MVFFNLMSSLAKAEVVAEPQGPVCYTHPIHSQTPAAAKAARQRTRSTSHVSRIECLFSSQLALQYAANLYCLVNRGTCVCEQLAQGC